MQLYSALPGTVSLATSLATRRCREGEGVRAGHVDVEHVRDIEHAGILAHGVVLFQLRAIGQRHVPAAEVDHSGAGGDVFVGQRCV